MKSGRALTLEKAPWLDAKLLRLVLGGGAHDKLPTCFPKRSLLQQPQINHHNQHKEGQTFHHVGCRSRSICAMEHSILKIRRRGRPWAKTNETKLMDEESLPQKIKKGVRKYRKPKNSQHEQSNHPATSTATLQPIGFHARNKHTTRV